jgi:glycosyltransferase involved in cell wall biosynthesis
MKPVVGIDASRYSVAQRTGTETYSWELLNAITALPEQPFDLRFYTNAGHLETLPTLAHAGELRSIPFPRFWTHARLSTEMLLHRPDLLFVPSHVVPIVHPRSVVTVHDLGYLHEPAAHPTDQRRMLDFTTRWNTKVAQIIAISQTTRTDLIERYRVHPDRITVVYHGVSSHFAPAKLNEIARIRALYALPEVFVLALGTIQPRKNLICLAQAVATLDGVPLVTAGRRGWRADEVAQGITAALPNTGQWIETGYVAAEDLPALISAAGCVAMVSTYEGFGLPVLEAMACGSPVVISDTPALVEIAGGAARIAPSRDIEVLATEVAAALASDRTTDSFVAAGRSRAARFTWERTAAETLIVLERALNNR